MNINDFVSQNVVYNVSILISEQFMVIEYLSNGDQEILYNLAVSYDYEEPARDYIEDMSIVECMEFLIDEEGELPYRGNARDQLLRYLDKENCWQYFCEDKGIDPYGVEALEHWIISEYLGRKLEEKGEIVEEYQGLLIWGRGTSGQSIAMDSVIEEIWEELQNI